MRKLGKVQLEFLKKLRAYDDAAGYRPGHDWTWGKGRVYDERICRGLVAAGYAVEVPDPNQGSAGARYRAKKDV